MTKCLLLRQAIESRGHGVPAGLLDPKSDLPLSVQRVMVQADMPSACSQCGKYPCECDDC